MTEKVTEKTQQVLNYRLGLYLALLGAFLGLVAYPLIFLDQYHFMMVAEFNKGESVMPGSGIGCMSIVKWYYPAFTDIGVLAGMLFLLSALYGFRNKQEWAFKTSFVATVMMLMTSFWPSVPALDTSNFPYHIIFIFLPTLGIYFGLTRYVKNLPLSRVLFGMVIGMAMITSFMNGIASTQRIMTLPDALYKITQRVNWFAGIGFGIIVVGVMLYPKAKWLGYTLFLTITLELLAGYGLGLTMSIQKEAFSMFLLGPLFTTVILVIILTKRWDKLVQPDYIE